MWVVQIAYCVQIGLVPRTHTRAWDTLTPKQMKLWLCMLVGGVGVCVLVIADEKY